MIFFFIVNGVNELVALLHILYEYFHGNVRVFTLHNGRNHQTFPAEIIKVEMSFRNGNNLHVAIQTAVESEIRHLGINGLVRRVINDNHHLVFLLHFVRKVYPPRRISAVVVSKLFTVQTNVRRRVRAVYFQIVFLVFG